MTYKHLLTKSNKDMQGCMQWVEAVLKEDNGISFSTCLRKTSDSVLMRHHCLISKKDKGVTPEAASAEPTLRHELKAVWA